MKTPDQSVGTLSREQQWQIEKEVVDKITDGKGLEIDPGIKDAVIALRLLGVNTTQSHEGDIERVAYPYIDIASKEHEDLMRERARIKEQLMTEEERDIRKQLALLYDGLDFVDPNSDEESALQERIETAEKGLDKFDAVANEDIVALEEKIVLQKEKEQGKMSALLGEFYQGRSVSDEVVLTLGSLARLGQSRLQSRGAELQEHETDMDEKQRKLSELQSEMTAFTEFLKAKFFESKMEKQPAFDKVIGGTEEQREVFLNAVDIDSEQLKKENLGDMLYEITEAENKSISQAIAYAQEIARYYGSTRTVDSERVFILKEGSVEEITDGRLSNGFYDALLQAAIVDHSSASFAITLARVVHECFHLTSLQVAKLYKDGSNKPYRSGIELTTVKDGVRKIFFAMAQEAIIATLTYRYFNEVIRNDPAFAEQVKNTETVKNWLLAQSTSEKNRETFNDILIIPDAQEWCRKIEDVNQDQGELFDNFVHLYNEELQYLDLERERPEERKKFDSVLNEIIERSNGKISNKDGLFDQFARAHFTGNFMPLARIIEDALGRGSFREIAEKLSKSEVTV